MTTTLALAATALAQVAPTPSDNDLQQVFDARSDPIDASTEGNITPTTFVPDCTITFEFILRDATFSNVFGWYNVSGSKPLDSTTDLFPLIDANTQHGDVNVDYTSGPQDTLFDGDGYKAALDIATDPRYAGGEIGFFLKTPEGCPDDHGAIGRACGHLFLSQSQFNDDNQYYHLLIFNSHVDRGFYFGWEDQAGGGDADFSDLVTYVSNIVCSGAGAACDTGMMGVCGKGTLQCQGGLLACRSQRTLAPEVCNGLDDDCNGQVDDGTNLCPPTQACRFGQCIQRCSGGELRCNPGMTCVDEVCVENACVGVDCPPGQVCKGGTCSDACTGVQCPQGQKCDPFVGNCVDPCAGVTCGSDLVCADGVCQPKCQCRPDLCSTEQMCGADGYCEDPLCAAITCDQGFRCVGGSCVDACTNVVCPAGKMCALGQCVAAPPVVDGGVPEDGGAGDGGVAAGDGGPGGDPQNPGCACSVPGAAPSADGPLGLGLLGLFAGLMAWRRRRG